MRAVRASPVVLLVEDDPGLAALERHSLEGAGFHVVEARRGSEALERLGGGDIDAVVLDYRLPDMDGTEVIHRLGDRVQTLPVLVLTGMEDPAVAETMHAAGVAEFIVKDLDLVFLAELPQRIRDALCRFAA